jgi:uncharacterized protein (TIGR01777 family)
MRVVVSGASGLIGTELGKSLGADGHTVVALVRRDALGEHESSWDPTTGRIDDAAIAAADVVVNLAGASIGDKRLTGAYQDVVLSSRVDSTSTIARAIARAKPTATLIQGSSMGFYGDRGTEPLTELLPAGDGFLADVSSKWEASAAPAVEAGARVVYVRTGLVLAPHGGFAKRLLPLARRGLIGALGNPSALRSWISLVDEVRAMRFLIESSHRGPANLVAGVVTNAQVVSAISGAFGHRSGVPVPSWVLKAAVGPAADDLLSSQNGVPAVLNQLGFEWTHASIVAAAKYVAQR